MDNEVDLTVATYFEIWRDLLQGESLIKAERIRALEAQLPARNRSAIEYKFRNISAVFQERDDKWLGGFSPLPNLQGKLRQSIDAYLASNQDLAVMIEAHGVNVIPGRTDPDAATEDVLVPPPIGHHRRASAGIASGRIGAMHDFQMRQLGSSGEAWVLAREKRSLERAGRSDLAARIKWSSKEVGDGLGYDIESFRPNGAQLLIEVKTTNYGILTPFYITRNESRCLEGPLRRFHLVSRLRLPSGAQGLSP